MAAKKETTSSGPMDMMKTNTMMVLIIGLVIGGVIGHLWTKVQMLEKNGSAGTTDTTQAAAQPEQPTQPTEMKIAKPDPAKDHWKGPKDARYVHVEYSDFECPFCKQYFTTLGQLEKDYATKMAFVYRQFPLPFHPLAQPGAEASECVASLGGNDAFWKFHDLTFTQMPNVTAADWPTIAGKAGVNQAAFNTCFNAKKFTQKVADQAKEGETAGVNATPTSVIYDMKTGKTTVIAGAYPYDQAKQMIETFMNQK